MRRRRRRVTRTGFRSSIVGPSPAARRPRRVELAPGGLTAAHAGGQQRCCADRARRDRHSRRWHSSRAVDVSGNVNISYSSSRENPTGPKKSEDSDSAASLDSVSCRFQVAGNGVTASDAVAPCPALPVARLLRLPPPPNVTFDLQRRSTGPHGGRRVKSQTPRCEKRLDRGDRLFALLRSRRVLLTALRTEMTGSTVLRDCVAGVHAVLPAVRQLRSPSVASEACIGADVARMADASMKLSALKRLPRRESHGTTSSTGRTVGHDRLRRSCRDPADVHLGLGAPISGGIHCPRR